MSNGVPISHQRQVLWILSLKNQMRGGEKGMIGRKEVQGLQEPKTHMEPDSITDGQIVCVSK